MDTSISNVLPVSTVSASYGSSKGVTQDATASAGEATDTVQLSQSAQIHALLQQGQGAQAIANALGVPVALVDGILGIVVAAAEVDQYIADPKANPYLEVPRTSWW